MKQLTLLLTGCLLFITVALNAQTPPDAFNYSAVARGSSGQPIPMKTIGIQISILKSSATGVSQNVENHVVNTDQFGLFNLIVGSGAVQSGNFSVINWSNDKYYLKVGMDVNGGTNFLTMGTTQLLSVPYALYAKAAGSAINPNDHDTSATNELQALSIKNDTIFLSNGGFVKLPTVGGNGGGFVHYIGEKFGGGVIFHLWKDSSGIEHGLIADTANIGLSEVWSNNSNLIGPSAQSSWNGLANNNAIVAQAGHINSAASLCLNSINGGQNDWYLPSIDELNLLLLNRFNVNKSLSKIVGATLLEFDYGYWSSSEHSNGNAMGYDYTNGAGAPISLTKGWYLRVRPIRSF